MLTTAIIATKPSNPEQAATWKTTVENIYSYVCGIINNNTTELDNTEELPCLFEAIQDLITSMGTALNNGELQMVAEKQLQFAGQIEQAFNTLEQQKGMVSQ